MTSAQYAYLQQYANTGHFRSVTMVGEDMILVTEQTPMDDDTPNIYVDHVNKSGQLTEYIPVR